MKSYNVVPGEKQMRIQVNMPHGHPPGWAPAEIGLFIDSKCRAGKALPVPGKPVIEGEKASVTCQSRTALKTAKLNYTTDTGLRSKRKWTSVACHHPGRCHHRPETACRRELLVLHHLG